MSKFQILISALIFVISSTTISAQNSILNTSDTTVESNQAFKAAKTFINAFDSLQWDEFRSYFADDISMFFPFHQVPNLIDGQNEVERLFRQFFDGQIERRSGQEHPLSMELSTRDWHTQIISPGAAVVSFHIGSVESPSRRSLVLRKVKDTGWKVVHWHASSIEKPKVQAELSGIELKPDEMMKYLGSYAYSSSGTQRELKVFSDSGKLKAEVLGGLILDLYYQGSHTFMSRVGETDIKIIFIPREGKASELVILQNEQTLFGKRKG